MANVYEEARGALRAPVPSCFVPTTNTVAVRITPIITGAARGNCTRKSIWRSLMPNPRAASINGVLSARLQFLSMRCERTDEGRDC